VEYNDHVQRWANRKKQSVSVDEFVNYDDGTIKWSRDLKQDLQDGVKAFFSVNKIRPAIYRPFTKVYLFFDRVMNEEVYRQPEFFPTRRDCGNIAIWLKVGSEVPFWALAIDRIPDLMPSGGTQCFPLYTYDGEERTRHDNIPLSTLAKFRSYFGDDQISKWDIFHYVYALLHHPEYRTRYAANLRRELPRIPILPNQSSKLFHEYAIIGRKLANLHVDYENAAEYPLERIENSQEKLNWRVKRMRFSKDKTRIIYNEFLTLARVPASAFDYRLGNRSALEWVVDQYQVSTDERSGITNDPNREDEPEYIVKLIGKVITVSLRTQELVHNLPPLEV
jgi:predicted helicase